MQPARCNPIDVSDVMPAISKKKRTNDSVVIYIMTSFDDLPTEIIRLLFEYFTPADIVRKDSNRSLLTGMNSFFSVFLGPYILLH